MRKSPLPLSGIGASIVPKHLSLSLSHILTKISFVAIPIRPEVLSGSIFSIITKVTVVLVAIFTDPYSFSFSNSVNEFPLISGSCGPKILSLSVGLAVDIVSFVYISIDEVLYAITMLDEIGKLA